MRLFGLTLAALGLSGCAEHWYSDAQAELELDIDGETLVDVRLVTPAEGWPRKELYSNALRVGMDGQDVAFVGEVVDGVVRDELRDIDDHWGDNVNVLDAWRDCEVGAHCDRTFRFRVSCVDTDRCDGLFSGDAFLSLDLKPHQIRKTGEPLRLRFTEVATDQPVD